MALTGSAYTYVIFNVHDRLRCIRRQMRRAMAETPQDTERIELMMLKHWMYQVSPGTSSYLNARQSHPSVSH